MFSYQSAKLLHKLLGFSLVIKKLISTVAIFIYVRILNLFRWQFGKATSRQTRMLIRIVYLDSFSCLPEYSPSYQLQCAGVVVRNLLAETADHEPDTEISTTDVDVLTSSILEKPEVKSAIADHFLLRSYYFQTANHWGLFDGEIEKALARAKEFRADSEPPTSDYIQTLIGETKKRDRNLVRSIRQHVDSKIDDERSKVLPPIFLSGSNVLITISILSTLFAISGFIYVTLLFAIIGIDASGIFSVSDYFVASSSVVSATLVSSLVASIGYVIGMTASLNSTIRAELLDTKKPGYNWPILTLTAMTLFPVVFSLIAFQSINPTQLIPAAIILVCWIILEIPFAKYFQNPLSLQSASLLLFVYFCMLAWNATKDAQELYDEASPEPLKITYKTSYAAFASHKFVMMNSSYLILWDREGGISILPKDAIAHFDVNDTVTPHRMLGTIHLLERKRQNAQTDDGRS